VRSVLVVMGATSGPRPIWPTHRARLWANDIQDHPDGIGAKAPRRQVVQANAVLQVADHVLDDGVSAVIGLEIKGLAIPVSDKDVVVT
jgi:hypothetical protein